MTKFAKIMIACFVAGILLLGIGCAVTFFEVSAIDYGGTKVFEAEGETVTDDFSMNFDENVDRIVIDTYHEQWETQVVADENVPVDRADLLVEYNSQFGLYYNYDVVSSDDYYDDYDHGEYDEYEYHHNSDRFLTANAYINLENRNVGKIMRQVVADLQNDVFYDYICGGKLTVRVNPANYDKVVFD